VKDDVFSGSIPEIYERILVPYMFGPFAEDFAARVGPAESVLEIAAGTGIVTRKLAARLPSARIVATDLNAPMIDRARSLVPNVEWRQADAQKLPFADGEFDVAVCQFGAMFFPDRVAAYREARRVAGRYVMSTWGPLSSHAFELAVVESLTKAFPEAPPRFLERTPHGYSDPKTVRADLEAAGFRSFTIDEVRIHGRASPRDLAIGYCHGTPTRNEIPEGRLDEAVSAVAAAVPAEGEMLAYVAVAS
jgi:SAM-dependent methyltransferase